MRTDQFAYGTPPRYKTIKRLQLQAARGMPVTGVLILTDKSPRWRRANGVGRFARVYMHPTKGRIHLEG